MEDAISKENGEGKTKGKKRKEGDKKKDGKYIRVRMVITIIIIL